MGIDLFMSGLEDCAEARCAPQQRDIVGYDPHWGRDEDETAAKVVRFERLDSPLFDEGNRLADLAADIGRLDEENFALTYDYELTPMHHAITEFLGPLWDRHPRRLEIINRVAFEEMIALYRHGDGGSTAGLRSWRDRDSSENCRSACANCPLRLPFNFRTDCHGWLSSYPSLPMTEHTLVAAIELMARLDDTSGALPDAVRAGLSRAGVQTCVEVVDSLRAVLPELEPAVAKWKVEWAWKSCAESLNEVVSGCDLLQNEPHRRRSDLAEHIMNCLVFKEPDIDSVMAARILPFFEAALPVMEMVAERDSEACAVKGWREYLACLRNVVRFGAVLSVSV